MDIRSEVTDPTLRKMLDLCVAEIPNFDIRFKNESMLMRLLGFILVFNKTFLTRYITTIGPVVYFPSKAGFLANQHGYVGVLAHELVHMQERKRTGDILYTVRYLFPQILAALSLLTVLAWVSPWFWACLLFLVFLAPLPSPGRRAIELNGYTMSLAVHFWQGGPIDQTEIDWYAAQFTGPSYYFMWPMSEDIKHELRLRLIKIRTGQVLADHTFQKVHAIVSKS